MLPQANLTFRSDTWLELATPRNLCNIIDTGQRTHRSLSLLIVASFAFTRTAIAMEQL